MVEQLAAPRGEARLVDDVPAAFVELVVGTAPRTLALSGGGTARRCYEALAGSTGLRWSEVVVLMGDERWVPVEHPDSNEGMARRALLDRVSPAAVHSMAGAGPTIDTAADAYDALLGRMGAIDLVHLGLGEDGHTASLFPRSPALAVTGRLVVPNGDDAHPHPRLTLTYPGLALARLAVVTVEGQAKAEAWRRLQDGDDLPAAHIGAERLVWLVDPAAAGRRA